MRCLRCNEVWNKNSVLNFVINRRSYICYNCKDKKLLHSKECGVSWYSLFYYRGSARICVIRSKISKKCLFSKHIKKCEIWGDIKDKLWLIPPSTREVNHLVKTMKCLNVEYQECFKKIVNKKQSKQKMIERKKGNLELIDTPKRNDIVIFDDTSTTGFTIREMVNKLGPTYNVIVLSFCTNKQGQ